MKSHPIDNNVYCDGIRNQFFWDTLTYYNFHNYYYEAEIEDIMLFEYHDEEGNFHNRVLSEDTIDVPTPRGF